MDLDILVFHPVEGGTLNCLKAHKKKIETWEQHTGDKR